MRFRLDDRSALMQIQNLEQLTRRGRRRAIIVSAVHIKKRAIVNILAPKSGRTYRTTDAYNRPIRHRASRRGETHANMTGKLRRSLGFRARSDELIFGYGVEQGNAPEYAEHLEFPRNRRNARPTLRIALRQERRNIRQTFVREIEREVNR